MRKLIVILSLVFTFSIVGGLYNTLTQLDKVENVTVEEAYTAQFPEQVSGIVVDPMVGFPVY